MSLQLFPIQTDEDLERAHRLISLHWDAAEGSSEEAFMDALATLADRYEREHYPVPRATPLEALRFFMEQNNRTQADLARLLGSRSRASEILNCKRDLTLDQIRKLHREWRIPVACLIGERVDA